MPSLASPAPSSQVASKLTSGGVDTAGGRLAADVTVSEVLFGNRFILPRNVSASDEPAPLVGAHQIGRPTNCSATIKDDGSIVVTWAAPSHGTMPSSYVVLAYHVSQQSRTLMSAKITGTSFVV